MTKPTIALLFGGRSGEHEVSLMSAQSVLTVLEKLAYPVIQIGITHEGQWLSGPNALAAFQSGDLAELTPVSMLPAPDGGKLYRVCQPGSPDCTCKVMGAFDIAFPALHGTFGEDGTIQGLLELADVAYVGSGVLASSVGMDKALFKDLMRTAGVPVAASWLLTRNEIESNMAQTVEKIDQLGRYPYFVKPANLGSSVGISKVHHAAELNAALTLAAEYDRRVLVEVGINAREIEVSVLGNQEVAASLPGEIIPTDEFYSYNAKYLDGTSRLLIPAPLTQAQSDQIREFAMRAYRAADCAGLARVDFLLDKDSGEIFISEINTMPGFTRISMYPKLWEASGVSYPELVEKLLALAVERKADHERTHYCYGGQA